MTTKVSPTCIQRLVPHFRKVEKAWYSGAAAQRPQEGQLEEQVPKQACRNHPQQQLDPPRKRRAESIPSRTDEAFECEDDSQYTDDWSKVLRVFSVDQSSVYRSEEHTSELQSL